jgi:hypothetical protein
MASEIQRVELSRLSYLEKPIVCKTCHDLKVPVRLGDGRKLTDFRLSSIAGCSSCSLICAICSLYSDQISACKDHIIEVWNKPGLAWIKIILGKDLVNLEITVSEGAFTTAFTTCREAEAYEIRGPRPLANNTGTKISTCYL